MIDRINSRRREISHGRVPTKFISKKIKNVGKRISDKCQMVIALIRVRNMIRKTSR
jgi:hypothetical protein